ncbi:MAG: hypothetical protein ACPGKR_04515 [Poseidonia sp.]
MASSPRPALVMILLLLNVGVATGAQTDTSTDEGQLLDVRVFSQECLNNASCEPTKPPHIVEYFSADWCEPCVQVGDQLSNLSSEEAIVLQHHPSSQDATFLPASKLKYDHDFRLLFYPSIVVDGQNLLTGSRQALDLNSVMENSTPSWSGLESLRVENATLSWDASLNGTVSVWMLAPTPHQLSGKIHPAVAYEHVAVEAVEGSITLDEEGLRENTSFVVLLEQPGRRTLTVASLAPTGSVDVSDGREVATTTLTGWFDADFAMVVGLVLVLSLAPAFVIHRELMTGSREQKAPLSDPEE